MGNAAKESRTAVNKARKAAAYEKRMAKRRTPEAIAARLKRKQEKRAWKLIKKQKV